MSLPSGTVRIFRTSLPNPDRRSGQRAVVVAEASHGYYWVEFDDGVQISTFPGELHPLPSSNPALAALPKHITDAPRDAGLMALGMHSLCDVLWMMPSNRQVDDTFYEALGTLRDVRYIAPEYLNDKDLDDLAADWTDDACGVAAGVLDGSVTAADIVRAVRAIRLWLHVFAGH